MYIEAHIRALWSLALCGVTYSTVWCYLQHCVVLLTVLCGVTYSTVWCYVQHCVVLRTALCGVTYSTV